jgi:hypothetical protein
MSFTNLSSRFSFLGATLLSVCAMAAGCGSDDEPRKAASGGSSGTAGSASGGTSGKAGSGGTGGGSGGSSGSTGSGGSSGSTGSGGASGSTGTGGDGGAAGADAGPLGTYVDCENGDDANDGMQATPFKTIEKAASVATSGQTIWVLDGVCSKDTEPKFNLTNGEIEIPDGVSLKAVNVGAVTLTGIDGYRSAGLKFLGSGAVSGFKFVLFGRAISASSGTLSVTATTFDDVYQGMPLTLSGTVQATLTPGGVSNYVGANQRGVAEVSGTAKLTISGGTFDGALASGISGASLLVAREQAEITLDGASFVNSTAIVAAASASGKISIINNSVLRGIASAVSLTGTAQLTVDSSRIENATGAAITTANGTPTILLSNSTITGGARNAIVADVYSEGRPIITITDSKLNDNQGGIYLNYGGTVDISKSEINDNDDGVAGCSYGIYFNNGSTVSSLKLRETSVQRNCLFGLWLDGPAGSTFDLGRGNDLGKNVITGNTTGTTPKTNLRLNASVALTVYAAGNTWTAGAQGAAAAGSTNPLPGQYAVTSGNFRDLTGAQAGENFTVAGAQAAGSKIRVAENACVPAGTCN